MRSKINADASNANILEAGAVHRRRSHPVSGSFRPRAVFTLERRAYTEGDGRQVVRLLRGTESVLASELDRPISLSSDPEGNREWCRGHRNTPIETVRRYWECRSPSRIDRFHHLQSPSRPEEAIPSAVRCSQVRTRGFAASHLGYGLPICDGAVKERV